MPTRHLRLKPPPWRYPWWAHRVATLEAPSDGAAGNLIGPVPAAARFGDDFQGALRTYPVPMGEVVHLIVFALRHTRPVRAAHLLLVVRNRGLPR